MFPDNSGTTNKNFMNTSIYANYKIVSNSGFKTTQNSSSITMLNHTISKTRSNDWGYSSTCDITGDNLYTLLEQLLDEVAYALNYAKRAYGYAGSAYDRANEAYTYAGQAYAIGNHSHPYASSSHTHSLPSSHMKAGSGGPYVNVNGTNYYLTNWQYSYNESTGGPQ